MIRRRQYLDPTMVNRTAGTDAWEALLDVKMLWRLVHSRRTVFDQISSQRLGFPCLALIYRDSDFFLS
jgi:hypothetical protein